MARIKFHGGALLPMVQYHCPVMMAIKVNGIRSESFQHFEGFRGSNKATERLKDGTLERI